MTDEENRQIALMALRKARIKFLRDMRDAKKQEANDPLIYAKVAANTLRRLFRK